MKVLKWLDQNLEEVLLAALLVVLTSLITLNVILRYALGSGITWSEEVCRYTLVFSCFISIPHWVRRGSGIAVDLVVQMAPEKVKKILRICTTTLTLLFFAFLFTASVSLFFSVAATGQRSGAITWLEMKWVYTAPIIGFGLAAIRGIQALGLLLIPKKKEA